VTGEASGRDLIARRTWFSSLINPTASACAAPTSLRHSFTILAKGPGLRGSAVRGASVLVASCHAILINMINVRSASRFGK